MARSLVPKQQWARRLVYELIHVAQAVGGRATFNFGYAPADPLISGDREFAREADHIQLYAEVLALLPWHHTTWCKAAVLEVAAAGGGGLRFLRKRYGPREVVGVDISTVAVYRARFGGLDVYQADAHQLPFASGRFDCVICIDALDYLSRRQFLEEVGRVLVAGGRLLVTASGMRWPAASDRLRTFGEVAGFELETLRDLSPGVLRSVASRHPGGETAVRYLPRFLRPRAREMLMLPGSERYRRLLAGESAFVAALFRATPGRA